MAEVATDNTSPEVRMNEAPVPSPPPNKRAQRIVGLDIFRGLTMAVMLIVDYNGNAIASIDHAHWNGIHLADFVMPFFLFISGVSMSISIKVPPGSTALKTLGRVWYRALKLFIVGLAVQGGFYGINAEGYTYVNIDLATIRIMGILQRIALALAVVAAVELFVPTLSRIGGGDDRDVALVSNSPAPPKGIGLWIFYTTGLKWLLVLAFLALQLLLTYAVKAPATWPGCSPQLFQCQGGTCSPPELPDELKQMGCSGVGYLDSIILGIDHVYIKGTNAVDGPVNFGFDPEGLVTSWGAVFTMYFGLHIGRAFRELKTPLATMSHWMCVGIPCMIAGIALNVAVPFNKRLWSPSYNLFMCGAATIIYAGLYMLCDAAASDGPDAAKAVSRIGRILLAPLQWLGSNCILFFVLSDCCGILDWVLRALTWGQPHTTHNLVYFFDHTVLGEWLGLASGCKHFIHPPSSGDPCAPVQVAHTIAELLMWVGICGLLYRKGIFWKI